MIISTHRNLVVASLIHNTTIRSQMIASLELIMVTSLKLFTANQSLVCVLALILYISNG
jgi:hypothetical protein